MSDGSDKLVVLKRGKERSVRGRHPWVFSGAIERVDGEPGDGDVVTVADSEGSRLASGHYFRGSIAVRIVAFSPIALDAEFWRHRIEAALRVRTELGLTESSATDAFRLINAEGDQLPGLIVDLYRSTAVVQVHSTGMYNHRSDIVRALTDVLGAKLRAVYLQRAWDKASPGEVLYGTELDSEICENGARFLIDIRHGQKTGFFLDQRDNRWLVGQAAKGRRVLNTFCYSGGFSVFAAHGGALEVDSVDSSKTAIELCRNTLTLNQVTIPHREIEADCMEFLRSPECRAGRYDCIVVDPPAFAKHRSSLPDAERGYRRLNEMAIAAVADGGLVATFSCSQVVSAELFQKLVFQGAANLGREVRILRRFTQPSDHPVSLFHPEGEYLKGLLLRVG